MPRQSLRVLTAAPVVTTKIFVYDQGRPGPSSGFGSICGDFRISFRYVPPLFFPFRFFLRKGHSGKWGPRQEMAATLRPAPAASWMGCSEGLSRAVGCTKCSPAAPSSSWRSITVAGCQCPSKGPRGLEAFLRYFCSDAMALRKMGRPQVAPGLRHLWGTGFTTDEVGAQ